jgi:predicted GNAT superfamily acetyltransferase
MRLRDARASDRPALLALNLASLSELSELDDARLAYLLSIAHLALVAEDGGDVIAFALAIAPGTDYDSRNYRWFAERFERFLYLDRIAVERGRRRQGVGARLYDAMEAAAREFGRMVCDVNLEPRNDASLAFHTQRGYRQISRLEHPEKVVALMSKELARSEPAV